MFSKTTLQLLTSELGASGVDWGAVLSQILLRLMGFDTTPKRYAI